MSAKIGAITFDWYGSLANHRRKIGRGRQFSEYLASQGLQSAPWDRHILYDVFEFYGREYKPESSGQEKQVFWIRFTEMLFDRSHVGGGTASQSEIHAAAIRDIFGSACFELYSDVLPVLAVLKKQGLRLAVVSNWYPGLDSFCHEMGLSSLLDAVISSSDAGIEKPDARIYLDAVHRLGVKPDMTVHVDDSPENFRGAVAAGLRAILIDRRMVHCAHENRINGLSELPGQLCLAGCE